MNKYVLKSLWLTDQEKRSEVAKRMSRLIDKIQMEIIEINWPSVPDELKKTMREKLLVRLNSAVEEYDKFLSND